MILSNQNNYSQIKPRDEKEMEWRSNRRALSALNENLVRINPNPFPCVVNKRDLSEKNGTSDTNRPIQRSKMALSPEEEKKAKFTIWEDIPLTDAKDQSLGQTEIDKDQMVEEVEMEDIFEETVMDIDSGDARNPLAVVEYVDDLYAYYKKMENCGCVSPVYMAQQADINERMRAILIDWLIEVHHKFDLRDETLFLTVNLIDRYLEKQQSVERKKLQLVGLVAMLLASKYEEVLVPVVDDLIFISDKAYTRKDILEMEWSMLHTLHFTMSLPTAHVFIARFLKAATHSTSDNNNKVELLAFYLIELCLVEYEMLKYSPSLLAAAAVYAAQCTFHCVTQWCKTCECYTGYSEDQLLECTRLMVRFHENAAMGKLTGVYRKYSTRKFGYVAKLKPAKFLL